MRVALGLFAIAATACAPQGEELPPLGEVLLVVDTDAPAVLAARLRVDVYGGDGTWIDSRDLSMASAGDWPGSLSLYADEGVSGKGALIRLRAYPEGRVRDYLGERFSRRPTPGDPDAFAPPPPLGDGQPRLVVDGVDVTPPREPDPALAIDRLVEVSLDYGTRVSVEVTLRAACFGTMADLAGHQTCGEVEALLAPIAAPETSTDMTVSGRPSHLGEAATPLPCQQAPRAGGVDGTGAPLFDEEVCVPGGLYVLGSYAFVKGSPVEEVTAEGEVPPEFGGVPERVARIPPMRVDRYEVTVARWRHAVDVLGFIAPDPSPQRQDGPFPTTVVGTAPQDLCTYSAVPLGRERHPVSCVTWTAARAFCRFQGGDLLTEAQWERVASASGAAETVHAWGDEPPACDRAVYGRSDDPDNAFFGDCLARGFGPQPVDSVEALADVTPTLGVSGLAGNLAEWTLDAYRSYGTLCWAAQPIADPRCWQENADFRSYRGGNWTSRGKGLRSVARYGLGTEFLNGVTGFRCMRPG